MSLDLELEEDRNMQPVYFDRFAVLSDSILFGQRKLIIIQLQIPFQLWL